MTEAWRISADRFAITGLRVAQKAPASKRSEQSAGLPKGFARLSQWAIQAFSVDCDIT
jgi:hypothetical protein